jgi:hypothetical protein
MIHYERMNKILRISKVEYYSDNENKILFYRYHFCKVADLLKIYLYTRMCIGALFTLRTFFIILYIFTKLSRIKITWSFSVFGVVIIHTIFMIVSLSFITWYSFKIFDIKMLIF